jgi:hypothetical protein
MLQYCVVLSLLLFAACSHQRGNADYEVREIDSVSFQNISIPIDSVSLLYYKKNCSFILDGENCLAGYNPVWHTIDVFNLDKKTLIKHIKLEENGPHEVMKVYGLFVHTLDSIFVFDPSGLKLVNESGFVRKLPYEFAEGSLISVSGSGIHYDAGSRSVFMYFQAADFSAGKGDRALAKPIVAEFHIETGKIDLLPVYYSEYIQKNRGDFSSDIVPNLTFYKDRIVCNFMIDSEICLYNRKEASRKCVEALTTTAQNQAAPYSTDGMEMEQRILTATLFQKVYFLPNENMFVRAHWGNQPFLKEDMTPNTMMTKPAFLMGFDEQFKKLFEIPIDREKYFPDDYFVTGKGLYLWRDFTKIADEDSLRLGLMRLH